MRGSLEGVGRRLSLDSRYICLHWSFTLMNGLTHTVQALFLTLFVALTTMPVKGRHFWPCLNSSIADRGTYKKEPWDFDE